MIVVPVKPKDAQEYDRPIIHFEQYSDSEIIEFFKSRPGGIKIMHDEFPQWFEEFSNRFGQDVADEILALA